MHIVGGLYRELCDVPHWDATFGSGGRAAAAVSGLSPGSILYTYVAEITESGARNLEELGIVVRRHEVDAGIAFVYFHPLSSPHLEPPRSSIVACPSIAVQGDAILRFGFVEGDAVVDGNRVVYDPQTHHAPAPFGANGSKAGALALVMNEIELGTMEGTPIIATAAESAMDRQGANVIVVKAGIRGATVFERGKRAQHVPAFRSTRVFKIGTGDVFSATFAHHWAEARMPAYEAALLASKAVASYCETRILPPGSPGRSPAVPLSNLPPGPIEITGAIDTIGQRWTMEEARFRLRELGLTVHAPILGDTTTFREATAALLVLGDGIDPAPDAQFQSAIRRGLPVVILQEGAVHYDVSPASARCTYTDDFASALYLVAWAATPEGVNLQEPPLPKAGSASCGGMAPNG